MKRNRVHVEWETVSKINMEKTVPWKLHLGENAMGSTSTGVQVKKDRKKIGQKVKPFWAGKEVQKANNCHVSG